MPTFSGQLEPGSRAYLPSGDAAPNDNRYWSSASGFEIAIEIQNLPVRLRMLIREPIRRGDAGGSASAECSLKVVTADPAINIQHLASDE